MKLDTKSVAIWILALGILGGAAFLPALYNIGLFVRPSAPVAATVQPPALIRAALWANAEGRGEPRLDPVTPWSLFSFVTCNVYVAATEPPEQRHTARGGCFDRQAGVLLAGQLSRAHMDRALPHSPRWALSQAATMAELTRTWDIDRLIDTLAAEGAFGHGWTGVDQASEGYFGKRPVNLTAAEAALMALQAEFPRASDPWRRPELAIDRRNELLQRMRGNGALDDETAAAAVLAPLGVRPVPPTSELPPGS